MAAALGHLACPNHIARPPLSFYLIYSFYLFTIISSILNFILVHVSIKLQRKSNRFLIHCWRVNVKTGYSRTFRLWALIKQDLNSTTTISSLFCKKNPFIFVSLYRRWYKQFFLFSKYPFIQCSLFYLKRLSFGSNMFLQDNLLSVVYKLLRTLRPAVKHIIKKLFARCKVLGLTKVF